MGFNYKISIGLGETETVGVGGAQTKSQPYQDPEERSNAPTKCWRVSCGGVSQQELNTGTSLLSAAYGKVCFGINPYGGGH